MIPNARYRDTPSIIQDEIVTPGGGRKLRYVELTGLEKRDFLFDQGIRATSYERLGEDRPDIVSGIAQFSKSALDSIANHLLSDSVTRVSDELPEPKPKLFHTYGATAKIMFTPAVDTPYTGILREKAPGLARFSYAGPVTGIGVVPGLGLKFPIDGDCPSENLVAMRMLDRQQPLLRFFSKRSHNSVFQNPFTNILPLPRLTNLVMHRQRALRDRRGRRSWAASNARQFREDQAERRGGRGGTGCRASSGDFPPDARGEIGLRSRDRFPRRSGTKRQGRNGDLRRPRARRSNMK